MYMGDFIVIEEETGPFEFSASSVSTGTPFHARIDGDKRHLFSDRAWIRKHPSACPFLRPSGDRIVCTIHETSPAQCKAYRCVVARVISPSGLEVGYVTGALALHSTDPALRDAWDDAERYIAASPDGAEERIATLLGKKGYTCI